MFQRDSISKENMEEGRSGKLLGILYLPSQLGRILQRICLPIISFVTSAKFYCFIFIASLAANLMLFYSLFPVSMDPWEVRYTDSLLDDQWTDGFYT